ncbi:hypothetical protein [Porphyrobacter sp. AAP60]|uniref:hypothetical protein n=1 Tax=Porphyrobacter sp. AAP60 TaxID=1523423 RepID=UPI000A80C4B5|nr:hypothetical protein [Porphyrobacter sp. AAP60]
MRSILSAIVMAALAFVAFAAAGSAQAQDASWTGTWNSQHGELRLIQEGSRVYGDYAERGYFEGRVSQDGTRLRGTFQYNSPRTSNGYIEFRRSGSSFTGGWNWARSGPVDASKGNWKGSLKSAALPQLRYAVGRDEHWADFWTDAGSAAHDWSFAGVPAEEDGSFAMEDFGEESAEYQAEDRQFTYVDGADAGDDTDDGYDTGSYDDGAYTDIAAPGGPWMGTFSTNHGDIRLIQIGNRVFGDYAARGFFEGCVHNSGQTLRGTFQYLSPRSKHGFIEFRLNDDLFEGQWTWTSSGLPRAGSAINWRGTRKASDAPTLTSVDQDGTHFADMWNAIGVSQRAWVLGQQGSDQCAASGL